MELIAALKQVPATDLKTVTMDTDHPLSDHRLALERSILDWLQRRHLTPAR